MASLSDGPAVESHVSKLILLVLAAGLLAGLGWSFRDVLGGAAANALGSPTRSELHKCIAAGGQVLYTQDACPPGSRAEAVAGGAVTVLPAAPVAAVPPAASAGLPNVRDALLGPGAQGAQDLKDRRMDRVIGR